MKARPIVVALLFVASVAFAEDRRITNWSAPAHWMPPAAPAGEEPRNPGDPASREALGRTPLAPAPVPLPFIALFPCRLVDTRAPAFPAPLGGGFLPPATVRSYTLAGECNVPEGAQAISLNVTVVKPTGPGFITLWPEGGAFPPVSTLNFLGGDVIVNAAVVPLSGKGGISMALGVSGGDVILDTNGYYAPVSKPAPSLVLTALGASTSGAVSRGLFGCLTFDTAAVSAARLDLPLPAGAVITGVSVVVHDGGAGAMSVTLRGVTFVPGVQATDAVASAALSTADVFFGVVALTGLNTSAPVGESQRYYVEVTAPAHLDPQTFCGASVTYTVP